MLTSSQPPSSLQPSPRLLSLDAFRGLVIGIMFLVNVGGTDPAFTLGAWAPGHYRSWMPHTGWNAGRMGNGLADYVFPWFLFIVGVAIPFSMNSGRGKSRSWASHALLALKRATIIYLLGTLMWCATIGYGHKAGPIDWRIILHWDILPLIGFGYLLAALLYHAPRWAQISLVAAVLVFKWYTLTQGLPAGITGYRDMLEQKKSLHHAIGSELGWWGTMFTQGFAFGSLVILGSLVGEMLRTPEIAPNKKTQRLATIGAALSTAAMLWWLAGDMPFSKDYVSPTFILITSGTACLVLALMHWIIDVRTWTSMTFLRVFGVNALFVYVLAEFLWKTCLMQWQTVLPPSFQPATLAQGNTPEAAVLITAAKAWLQYWATTVWSSPALGTYMLVAIYIGLLWLACLSLYRKKWYVKV